MLNSLDIKPLAQQYFNFDAIFSQYRDHNFIRYNKVNTAVKELLTWYFGTGGNDLRNNVFMNHSKHLFKQEKVRLAYNQGLEMLASEMDDILRPLGSSLTYLVNDILELCQSKKQLRQVFSRIQMYLQDGPYNNGLEHYVAQLREVYMVRQVSTLL